MQPDNAIIGDAQGIDLPQATPDETALDELKGMVEYSKNKEFARIKTYFEDRIAFFQTHLPDGRPVNTVALEDLDKNWQVANIVIGEFNAIINIYEQAETALTEATKNG